MKKTATPKESRNIPKIFFYLVHPSEKKGEFVDALIKKIPHFDDIGYAGYKNKSALRKFLLWSIYNHKKKISWRCPKKEAVRKQIIQTLNLCRHILNKNELKIFVFPTVNSFVIEKMRGVSGFATWRNTILINIYQTSKLRDALKETVGHELAHALALNFNDRVTLQDHLVFEGIAEHFRENFLEGKKAGWVKSISKERAKLILKDIKKNLKQRNEKLYKELFFGTGKYPMWAGYAIGYHLVESHLKSLNKIDWKRILRTSTSKIMENNDFRCG